VVDELLALENDPRPPGVLALKGAAQVAERCEVR
jgi:hypothetical protein